jgi:hypothetical protein
MPALAARSHGTIGHAPCDTAAAHPSGKRRRNMATATTTGTKQEGEARTQGSETEGVGSPISNEAYDVIAALHSKLEGLEAYRKYSKDENAELWRDLTQVELQSVGKLVDQLERIVKDGKLRMQEPGKAH